MSFLSFFINSVKIFNFTHSLKVCFDSVLYKVFCNLIDFRAFLYSMAVFILCSFYLISLFTRGFRMLIEDASLCNAKLHFPITTSLGVSHPSG